MLIITPKAQRTNDDGGRLPGAIVSTVKIQCDESIPTKITSSRNSG
ncbi:unnamed protein product [Schistosoma mattheei]|uniref:Uncharacterized protein n=1 Tax=Schistosoma mattheei TaxID=31246 RepID=A0A3P8GQ05_9TREM|nr:unnamed protein product [Schistosoma mattheei]